MQVQMNRVNVVGYPSTKLLPELQRDAGSGAVLMAEDILLITQIRMLFIDFYL